MTNEFAGGSAKTFALLTLIVEGLAVGAEGMDGIYSARVELSLVSMDGQLQVMRPLACKKTEAMDLPHLTFFLRQESQAWVNGRLEGARSGNYKSESRWLAVSFGLLLASMPIVY